MIPQKSPNGDLRGRHGSAAMRNVQAQLTTLGGVILTGPGDAEVRSVLGQPKRLALLIYLAAALPRGYHRKDILLALFWPESPEARARKALNRSVYFLRHALHHDLIVSRGDEDIGLSPDELSCDAVEFDVAFEDGRLSEALELYRGDFAPGFFVEGLGELERWFDQERTRLRDRAVQAALTLATQESERAEFGLASHWAHRATLFAPHNERAARQYITLLDQAGDRAAALLASAAFAKRLRDDLGVDPAAETLALEARLRARPTVGPAPSKPLEPRPHFATAAAAAAPQKAGLRWRRSATWALATAVLGSVLLAGSMFRRPVPLLSLGRRTAVAVAPEFERWPSLSPDGQMIYYTLSSMGHDELYARQVNGGPAIPLTEDLPGSQRYGALSPDGSRLLLLGDDGLYVMPALGGPARRVVADTGTSDLSLRRVLLPGSWSPEGERIVYPERDTLFVQDLGSGLRQVVTTAVGIHSPAWSPNGRWIAYVQGNAEFHLRANLATSSIRLVPAQGGVPVVLTDDHFLHTSPVWAPGGHVLLFISDREGGRDVYQLSLADDGTPANRPFRLTTGLSPERLTIAASGRRLAWTVFTETSNLWVVPTTRPDSLPLSRAEAITRENQFIEAVGSVSPDGAWIYYHGDRSGHPDLWRMPLGGGLAQRLTEDSSFNFSPSLSPDGQELAFFSLTGGKRDVFVMPAAGGAARQVSRGPCEQVGGIWSPDGRGVAWWCADTLRVSYRSLAGEWTEPVPLLRGHPVAGNTAWSPDGRWISYPGARGLELRELATGHSRLLRSAGDVTWHAWSANSKVIFGMEGVGRGRIRIVAIPLLPGPKRVLAYADHPLAQLPRYGLVLHGAQLYLPLVERRADLWVGDLER